jgi:hypothetical protein
MHHQKEMKRKGKTKKETFIAQPVCVAGVQNI